MPPTIFDLLDRLAFARGTPAAIIVVLAAFIAVVAWDMRIVVVAVAIQYLLSGLLFADLLDPRLAVVYTISGVFVTMILLVTLWQVNWGRPPAELTEPERTRDSLAPARQIGPFSVDNRVLLRLALGCAVIAIVLWRYGSPAGVLPGMENARDYLAAAATGLMALGLVGLAASSEPLPSGIGLLLFLNGFALFYSALDQSIAMAVCLASAQLIVAVVTAYLAQARFLPVDRME